MGSLHLNFLRGLFWKSNIGKRAKGACYIVLHCLDARKQKQNHPKISNKHGIWKSRFEKSEDRIPPARNLIRELVPFFKTGFADFMFVGNCWVTNCVFHCIKAM